MTPRVEHNVALRKANIRVVTNVVNPPKTWKPCWKHGKPYAKAKLQNVCIQWLGLD